MSFVKVMVHAVWGTKSRLPLLRNGVRQIVCEHIKQNAKSKEIRIDTINGHADQLHCLAELNPELTISKQLQLIKGESSYWINKNELVNRDFAWAEDYYAVSVSESDMERVRHYIETQEEHHKKISFKEEFDLYIKEFNRGL